MSIFDGMEKLGLGHLKDAEIYAKDSNPSERPKKAENVAVSKDETKEEDFLYKKEYECPVCGSKFKSIVVKTGKARLIKQDKDLRPIHKGVDSMKYDVVSCNICGYAVLSRYYGPLAKPHKEMLKSSIAVHYKAMPEVSDTINYSESYLRYKLALANAVCRQAKDSEKALICLKTAWLIRGLMEHPEEVSSNEELEASKLPGLELEYLKEAMNGFIKAREAEAPPIAGMNEVTLDYLLSVLCLRFDDYENAVKLLQSIISSGQAGSAQKDKARDIMAEIREKLKAKKAGE